MMGLVDLFPQPNLADTSLPAIGKAWRKNNLYLASNWVWTQAVASTPVDYAGYFVSASSMSSSTENSSMIGVATGTAGAEKVIAVIPSSRKNDPNGNFDFSFSVPRPIPAGTAISLSSMAWTNYTCTAQVALMPVPLPQVDFASQIDYGPVDLLNNGGGYGLGFMPVFPATAHVKSDWQEITAAGTNNRVINGGVTMADYAWLGLVVRINASLSGLDTMSIVMDLAHGLAGSEVPFIEGMYIRARTSFVFGQPTIFWIPWGRPAGDRISVRLQHSNAGIAQPNFAISFIGLR